MGALTRGNIVSEGLLIVGDPSLTTRANIWLNAGLRRLYRSWPWPFLHKRLSGLSLPSGTTSLAFGAGSTETLEVVRIFDPIIIYASTYNTKAIARIVQLTEHSLMTDEVVNDPSVNIGVPTQFRVAPSNSTFGLWALKPSPVPDRSYLLTFDYLFQPADVSSDSTVPIYPSDETLLQIVVAAGCRYIAGDDPNGLARAQREESSLEQMMVGDRLRYGSIPGINDQLDLDSSRFG